MSLSLRLAAWIIFWGCTAITLTCLTALAAPTVTTIIGVK